MRPERSVRWLPVRTATVALAFVLVQPMLIGTAAAVPTVVAVNETRVTIPFVPPVGKTLHYRLSRSQSDSKKDKATSIDLYVRFERAGENGYRLHTRMAVAGIPAAARQTALMRILEMPVIFHVDGEGTITGVEDESEYWKKIKIVFDTVPKSGPAATADEKQIMATVYDQMRRLPDEQRLALISKNVRPIVEMTGGEFELGEAVELDDEAALPLASLADSKLPRRMLLTATASGPDAVTVAVETHTDPAALKAALERLVAMGPKGRDVKIPEMELSQKSTYLVSRKSGLTRRYSETIQSVGASEQAKRITTLELLE